MGRSKPRKCCSASFAVLFARYEPELECDLVVVAVEYCFGLAEDGHIDVQHERLVGVVGDDAMLFGCEDVCNDLEDEGWGCAAAD